MANHEVYYNLSQFQAERATCRWWPKIVAICAIFGGIYGAAIGSAISTTAGAADVIVIAAGVLAVLCGVPGARFGLFFGILNRAPLRSIVSWDVGRNGWRDPRWASGHDGRNAAGSHPWGRGRLVLHSGNSAWLFQEALWRNRRRGAGRVYWSDGPCTESIALSRPCRHRLGHWNWSHRRPIAASIVHQK